MSESFTVESRELRGQITAFLNFCRIEKGLSANSLSAYSADLSKFSAFLDDSFPVQGPEEIRNYIDHLHQRQLGNRSIARHLTTLRSFYGFLLREGTTKTDPTQLLRSPRQWQTIPKFLNQEEIEALLEAPDAARPTGLRDRAMLQLLYATGLRVSELCRVGGGRSAV
jgi:integrase/recombinase XerD